MARKACCQSLCLRSLVPRQPSWLPLRGAWTFLNLWTKERWAEEVPRGARRHLRDVCGGHLGGACPSKGLQLGTSAFAGAT